jgi:hypothetical protein
MRGVKRHRIMMRIWVVVLVAAVVGSIGTRLIEDARSFSVGSLRAAFGAGAFTQSVNYGPVSRASDPACRLLEPDQIKTLLGSSPAGLAGGRIPGTAGDACIYALFPGQLTVDRFTGMDERKFEDRSFLTDDFQLSSVSGFGPVFGTAVDVTGIGDQAVAWPQAGVVAFREGSLVVVVAVLGGRSESAAATSLARDAAAALP